MSDQMATSDGVQPQLSEAAATEGANGEQTQAAALSTTSDPQASTTKHGRGLAALLPHRHHDDDAGSNRTPRHPSQESAIGSMLAPALSIAGVHNPFAIGALREDGSRVKTYTYGKGDKGSKKGVNGEARDGDPSSTIGAEEAGASHASHDADTLNADEVTASVDTTDAASMSSAGGKGKHKKRYGLRSFGRSLSPWRYHHIDRKDSGSRPRRTGSWKSLTKLGRDSLDIERDRAESSSASQADSDAESIRSLAPRNSAFNDADSEDDEMSTTAESDVEGEKRPYSGSSRSSRKGGKGVDGQQPESEAERVKAAVQAGKSLEEVESEEEAKDEAEGEVGEGEDDGDDDDEYIEFDNETLDNTLYNAGCIDLHDAWMHPSPAARTPEDDMRESYYGPTDYDAAWKGAGPTGHDENDEGLRAPNVVIGQDYRKPSMELAGEGISVLKLHDDERQPAPVLSPHSAETAGKIAPAPAAKSSEAEGSSQAKVNEPKTLASQASPASNNSQRLVASRPTFDTNRCTITLVHGDYERIAAESKRRRRYIVASDGSEESSYAIEWTIGTVLRDGDEMLVVSAMETDTKLDTSRGGHHDKFARQEHQRIRQSMAVILARRAVAVLQRTRLAVKIACQAVHARNSRHMFIDMIDFFQPTMCVVGSRGLGSLKGVLLGSFSNYCVQKSPVPVMVARKRLKLPALPRGKGDVVSNVRRRHMRLDEAMIDKDANVSEEAPSDEKDEKDKEAESQGDVTKKAQDEALDESKDSTVGPDSTDSCATTATGGTRESADATANGEADSRSAAGIQQDAVQAAALQDEDKGKRNVQNLAADKQQEQINAEQQQQDRGRDRRSRSPTK